VAAGLQLVFGVQKILNLACGSFYALGAYFGVTATTWALGLGFPAQFFVVVLVGSAVLLGAIGPLVERILRTIYDRDESFQLLLTFALVLMCEDVIRFFWGSAVVTKIPTPTTEAPNSVTTSTIPRAAAPAFMKSSTISTRLSR
jgi:branched-chain amino acid transport system permease protein